MIGEREKRKIYQRKRKREPFFSRKGGGREGKILPNRKKERRWLKNERGRAYKSS